MATVNTICSNTETSRKATGRMEMSNAAKFQMTSANYTGVNSTVSNHPQQFYGVTITVKCYLYGPLVKSYSRY